MAGYCTECGTKIKKGHLCKNCRPPKRFNTKLLIGIIAAVIIMTGVAIAFYALAPYLLNRYEGDMDAVVESISIDSGTIGSAVSITGYGFGEFSPDKGVKIKNHPLTIVSWTDDEIIAAINDERQNGAIILHDGDMSQKSGYSFSLNKIKTSRLVSKRITDTSVTNIVEDKNSLVSVILPADLLDEKDELIISNVSNQPPVYDTGFVIDEVFDISLKSDTHMLNDYVSISFAVEDGENPEDYSIATFNEESLTWELLHESLIARGDGFITGMTNHFSLKAKVKVEPGYFRNVYHSKYFAIDCSNDMTVFIGSRQYYPEEFANIIGPELDRAFEIYCSSAVMENGWKAFYQNNNNKAQEMVNTMVSYTGKRKKNGFISVPDFDGLADDIKKIYDRPYPSDIDEASQRISIPVMVKNSAFGQLVNGAQEMTLGSKIIDMDSYEGETVQDIRSFLRDACIKVPYSYDSTEELFAMAVHELFHAFQLENFTCYGIGWFAMVFDESARNMWTLEATAEYAANFIAYDNNIDPMYEATFADKSFDIYTRAGSGQEYGMSLFIRHLIENTNADFPSIFAVMIDSDGAADYALRQYFTSITGKTMAELYGEFWDDLLTGNTGAFGSTDIVFKQNHYKKNVRLIDQDTYENPVNVNYEMSNNALNYFAIQPLIPDVKESRILRLVPAKNTGESIDIGTAMLGNGYDDKNLSHRNYAMYTFTKEVINGEQPVDTLLNFDVLKPAYMLKVANNDEDSSRINGSFTLEEVKTAVKPAIVNISPGTDVKFTAKFSNVFDFADKLEVEWDFGDGKTESRELSYRKSFTDRIKHEYKETCSGYATVRLYDITGGVRTMIANHRVLLGEPEELIIKTDKTDYKTNDEIKFLVEGEKSHYYEWSFDGRSPYGGTGQIDIRKSFDTKGDHLIKVTSYNNEDKEEVVGHGELKIDVKQGIAEITLLPDYEIVVYPGDEIIFEAVCSDLAGFPEGYDIEWTCEGSLIGAVDGVENQAAITFPDKGFYHIDVTARDSGGAAVAQCSRLIEVSDGNDPGTGGAEEKWVLVGTEIVNNDIKNELRKGEFYNSITNVTNGQFSGTLKQWWNNTENPERNYDSTISYTGTFTPVKNEYKPGEEFRFENRITLTENATKGDIVGSMYFSNTYSTGVMLEYKGEWYDGASLGAGGGSLSSQDDAGTVSEVSTDVWFPESGGRIFIEFMIHDSATSTSYIRFYFKKE